MNKNELIRRMMESMGNDPFGPSRLRKIDQKLWKLACQREVSRLGAMSYSDLETLYRLSEGLYESAA